MTKNTGKMEAAGKGCRAGDGGRPEPEHGGVAVVSAGQCAWYAVHSKSRHEKQVAERLKVKGFEVFLPLIRRTRVSSGRRVVVEAPLFSCYLFVNSEPHRLQEAGWTRGVIRILGANVGQYTPVPDGQVEKIRIALETGFQVDPHPYVKEGQRVRVKYGPLAGLEGVLVKKGRHHRFVVTVNLIARSACLTIHADDVEPM